MNFADGDIEWEPDVSGGFAFSSDSSDDSVEYDADEMEGPEALLFKQFGVLWPGTPFDGAKHHRATRQTCPICSGAGWLWVLPPPPSRPSTKS